MIKVGVGNKHKVNLRHVLEEDAGMLQALYEGTPPLEAYPTADRNRIKAQQEKLQREQDERAPVRSDRA